MHHRRGERGQASLLAVGGIVLAVLSTVLVARVTVAAVRQARAQHAADAAALAGVEGGIAAAAAVASANGAELLDYRRGPGVAGGAVRVSVVVRWGDRVARAVAEGDPGLGRGPPARRGGTHSEVSVLYAR